MSASLWCTRPGLAGGIDKDGSRAAELLAAGFGSVEFGTVTLRPQPGHNPGVAALVAALSALDRQGRGATRIGIGLGAGVDTAPAALASEWLSAMEAAWPAADYLSFNLSARAYRPLLDAQHAVLLRDSIASVVRYREYLVRRTGRRAAVALKLPLGAQGPSRETLQAIAGMGLDALIAVLPEGGERLAALRELASDCRSGPNRPTLVAVGGIRSAEDVRAVRAAGAQGIQVHSVFAERGSDCLSPLLAGMSTPAEAGC